MMLEAWPKIKHVDDAEVAAMFNSDLPVELTEKIDGSCIRTCINADGSYTFGSKSVTYDELHPVEKMFQPAVNELTKVYDASNLKGVSKLSIQIMGEYLKSPHHNTLSYGRVPKHNVIIYAVGVDGDYLNHDEAFMFLAERNVDLEFVPLLWRGPGNQVTPELLTKLLENDSVLGKEKIEGVVVKSYDLRFELGRNAGQLMMSKYVRPEFQERNKAEWNARSEAKDIVNRLKDEYRSEGRWLKAIQHLRDEGKLSCSMRDIPVLINEVKSDIQVEDGTRIKNLLYEHYIQEICGSAIKGLPEFYKGRLANENMREN